MTYITVSDVRFCSGAPSSLISDATIDHAISIVEKLTQRVMNTSFKPTLRIDKRDGTGTDKFFSEKTPLLRPVALKSDGTDVDVSTLEIYPSSGKVILGEESTTPVFIQKSNSIVFKYYFGLVDQDPETQDTMTAESSSGDTTITVNDGTVFSTDTWIQIEGMDGNKEVVKIKSISGNDLTVDNTVFDHESGSLVTKVAIPEWIRRFMELEAAIYVGINAIGATYTFNASYSLGDLSIQKGVPYTHWKESLQKAQTERESLRGKIKPQFKIMT